VADEIIDEVRAVRERLLKEAGGTVDALIAWLRKLESAEKRPVVTREPRRATRRGEAA
jgi:hypothetical protein